MSKTPIFEITRRARDQMRRIGLREDALSLLLAAGIYIQKGCRRLFLMDLAYLPDWAQPARPAGAVAVAAVCHGPRVLAVLPWRKRSGLRGRAL